MSIQECLQCGHRDSDENMIFDPEWGWFCDTSGPDDVNLLAAERLELSECRKDYSGNKVRQICPQ